MGSSKTLDRENARRLPAGISVPERASRIRTLRAGRYPGSVSCSRLSLHGQPPVEVAPNGLHTAGNALPRNRLTTIGASAFRAAAAIASIALLAACSHTPVVTSVETFCHRVERFHATEAEREALKANSTALERLIRWVAGINAQWDANCLKPVAG